MTKTDDMTTYDPDTDPREAGVDTGLDPRVPLVTGEAPWLLQVSIKTPAGTLINVRGMEGIDVLAGLAAVRGMAKDIVEVEQAFHPAAAIAQPQPQQQYPQAPPPQQPQQQPQGNAPTCQCGYPAKFVPGGISKKTNRPYKAFWVCGNPVREAECSFRANG